MRDARDIERTMELCADSVWRACVLYLPPSEAEDVFQETFLKYAQHDAPFSDEGHVKAWLLRVAINGCKDVLRSARRRDVSLDERVGLLGDREIDDRSASEGGLREIIDAMDSLGDPPRTQLYLSLCEGYTAKEISRMCNMPEGTVYSWISRGKKRLREVLS